MNGNTDPKNDGVDRMLDTAFKAPDRIRYACRITKQGPMRVLIIPKRLHKSIEHMIGKGMVTVTIEMIPQ